MTPTGTFVVSMITVLAFVPMAAQQPAGQRGGAPGGAGDDADGRRVSPTAPTFP